MSNYQQKYSNGGVDHQTIADEIMSILGRLDALETRMNKGDGEYLYLDNLYDKLSQRLDALEGKGAVQNMADSIHLPYCENWEGATSFMINGVKYVPESCPAPEPTSEPKPCYLVDAVTGEPRSRLFAEYGDAHEVFGYNPATPAQIRAEAVRLGLLDAERQKVAEAFLHAALDSMAGKEDSYKDTAGAFLRESRREGVIHGEWLEGMASVLEAAAKGEK
jgi:hypothetical protein